MMRFIEALGYAILGVVFFLFILAIQVAGALRLFFLFGSVS